MAKRREKTSSARAVARILLLVLFYALVRHFSCKPTKLPEKILISHGAKDPTILSEPRGPYGTTTGEPDINAVYKMAESKNCYMKNHEAVIRTDEERLHQDWRQQVMIADFHVEYKADFICMLLDFQVMYDDNLGSIKIAKHGIELSPSDTKPIHSAPYRADLKAPELKKKLATCFQKRLQGRH